jgi:LuxR family maltose regulon positive regulatory protein
MVSLLSEAPAAPGVVRRGRLDAAVDEAIERPLTVVVAPAGWGKTVLLSAWARAHDVTVISVGPEHADPRRFLLDLEGGLETVATGRSSALVLDDVQLLDAHGLSAIRGAVRDDRGPIVVASRADPDLGLPRLRVEGRLGELRGVDLAFTDDELRALLDELGVVLPAERRRQLLGRTDGWAAGIRLAVVALQASSEPEHLLDEFSGDDRVVADYLTDEVLDALPHDVRDFLLRTSIVERLDVELAAALTDRDDAEALLADLERQGVFVVALDRRRRAYRYHALFAELLRARLRSEQPATEHDMHERAAEWFSAHGATELAVRHALAAGSRGRARDLLADRWLALMVGGHLPDSTMEPCTDPRLALPVAHARLLAGDRAGALERLAPLDGATGRARRLADLLRAHATHDLAGARRAGEAALDRDEDEGGRDDELARALAMHLLALSELAAGAIDPAGDRFEEAAALAAISGRERLRLECLGPMAAIEVLRGRLARAETHAAAALDLARRHGWEGVPAVGWALAALGAAAWLHGDLDSADRRAEAAHEAVVGRDLLVGDAVRALRAHLRAARDDEDGARSLLRLVHDAEPGGNGVLARWLEALGPAPWAPATGDGAADVTARAMRRLRAGDPATALQLAMTLEGLTGIHPTVRISAVLVEALARENLHEPGAAAALEHALALAELDDLRRPFLAAGAPLRELLPGYASLCTVGAPLLAELLDALPVEREDAALTPREPLSSRERAVLRLLPTMLPNSEIAGELFVSVNTVKTHVRSIYRKLGVGSRREAVARARDLGLL